MNESNQAEQPGASKTAKKEITEAVDAVIDAFNLYQEGHLSLEKLFLRWQKQGNRLASALDLPTPTWQSLPSFTSETRDSDREEAALAQTANKMEAAS